MVDTKYGIGAANHTRCRKIVFGGIRKRVSEFLEVPERDLFGSLFFVVSKRVATDLDRLAERSMYTVSLVGRRQNAGQEIISYFGTRVYWCFFFALGMNSVIFSLLFGFGC